MIEGIHDEANNQDEPKETPFILTLGQSISEIINY